MTHSSSRRGVRSWLSANGRLEFCITLVSVTLLTGACVALILVPRNVGPLQLATDEAEVLETSEGLDHPRLSPVRRDLQPYGPILVREVATGDPADALLVAHPSHRADLDVLEDDLRAPPGGAQDVTLGEEQEALVEVELFRVLRPEEEAGDVVARRTEQVRVHAIADQRLGAQVRAGEGARHVAHHADGGDHRFPDL